VLIVLDRSSSMWATIAGSQSKWAQATDAVKNLVTNFTGAARFGLLLFPQWPTVGDCAPGVVNVSVGNNTEGTIINLLNTAEPDGFTPMDDSLEEARVYLTGIDPQKPKYVVLVTDGQANCKDPVSPVTPVQAMASAGIKTFVVGFGSEVDPAQLTDLAVAGGTAQNQSPAYYQADNPTQLNSALQSIGNIVSCCGDGVVESWEKCDTAIPAGQPGSCAALSCDDGNPCTADLVKGFGCNVTCTHQPVLPKNGDGCCPPGANSTTDTDCPSTCGNGKLDLGEKCDTGIPSGQYGGCPTSCDDGNTCTLDLVSGNGCDAYCTNTNTCPTNLCGNGKVDAGELCDTAIPAGAPGACPASCDDGSPCTSDTLVGGGCVAQCGHLPITVPINGDGCCPPGATSFTDSDCSPGCGNGVVDPGESCDPGISSGSGACVTSCNDNDPCTTDFPSGSACNVTCGHTPIGPNPAVTDGCCPAGFSGKEDADCLPACDPDSHENCVDPCRYVQCPAGSVCSKGQCVNGSLSSPDGETPGIPTVSACDCRVTNTPPSTAASVTLLALALLGLAFLRRR
jgi:MYXO-CTERM domain-containing protein